jgi:PAS domain S-box-containing protein
VPLTSEHKTVVRYLCKRKHRSGQQRRRRQEARYLWVPLAVLAAIALSHPTAAAPIREVRRILILNEENATYPGIRIINQAIQAGLNDSPYQLQLYSEYMDTSLFPDQAVQQEFRDSYIRKYQNIKLDVIITVGPSPLKFMQEEHQRVFPGVPIVFCLPTLSATGLPTLDSDFTGVENDTAPAETVGIALRLVPGTRNVVVVGGVAPIDREVLANVKKELMSYEGRVEISYLTDSAMPDLLERLRHLPSNTIILLTSIAMDAAGTSFKSNESSPLIIGAASVPVFSLFDVHLNHGEVGGYLSSLREQGTVAGSIALRLLRGEKASQIPTVKGVNAYMFDWRALKRWGLKETEIPPGSIVLNRQPTVWDSYKWYIISGISLILLEALLIGGLVWQHAERLKSEKAVRASEERLKIFVKHVPAAVAMLDRDMRYLQVSDRWCADFSLDSSQILGRSHYEIFPDLPERWKQIHRRGLAGETLRAEEDRWDREGDTIWSRWEMRPWQNLEGRPGGILIFSEDITHRKHAEQQLLGLSGKLIEAQEQERARIGRELHDDIGQRLALLAVESQVLHDDTLILPEVRSRMGEFQKQISEIADDIQSLSHELHSAKLQYLGIASAMRGFCQEFARQQNVEIDFKAHDLPSPLSPDISLCLFRVLQEALHNSAKHSEVRQFEVRLWVTSDEIHLTVKDSGAGFDREAVKEGSGLGLISMGERLKLVKGTLSINSQPKRGTTIDARVPFDSSRNSARAAGSE